MNDAVSGRVWRLAGAVLDVVLPPRCLGCGNLVGSGGILCSRCWEKITFLGNPQCDVCGLPFEFDPGPGALCGACIGKKPAYDHARAAMIYDDASRGLVLAFKHGDRIDAAPAFGVWLARAGAGLLDRADLVVPAPLHWTRLFARRYNQSALLSKAVAEIRGVTLVPDLLVRRRRTPSQGRLSPSARRRNVAGAFAVRPRYMAAIKDQRVLLIDDVLTTGATADACAKTLLAAGAAAVDVLTLSRVVRER